MTCHLLELHDASNERLYNMIPKDQLDRVLSTNMCDIDHEFLGFVGIYERLSEIIPLNFTVVDLGCANAPQAFFFEKHKKYIGVDLLCPVEDRFNTRNSEHYQCSIDRFIKVNKRNLDIDSVFAICSYVPPWKDDNMALAREEFKNVFTFYPSSNDCAIGIVPST